MSLTLRLSTANHRLYTWVMAMVALCLTISLAQAPHLTRLDGALSFAPAQPANPDQRALPAEAASSPLSPQQAIAVAVNNLRPIAQGYQLSHPQHIATFTTEGLHFQPRLGGPTWEWQLTYIGSEKTTLAGVNLGAVPPTSEPGKVLYPRNGMTEQYLARAGSIEQQFIIPQPLALGGANLVIDGAVNSPGVLETSGSGWLWRSAEGVVRLGDVFVFDATGREIPATMSVTQNSTRIVVDGAALSHATYPVTVDPEIGANDFRISDMGPNGNNLYDAGEPGRPFGGGAAVAYNSTNNEYLVVWSGNDDVAAVDIDPDPNRVVLDAPLEIYGQRINAATGAEVGENDFRISITGNPDNNLAFDAIDPAIAYNSANNEYFVVWAANDTRVVSNPNEFEIYGQRLSNTGALTGAKLRISTIGEEGSALFRVFDPDVAYNSSANEYMVVWLADRLAGDPAEYEVFGQRLNAATGAEVGANDFRISDMGPDGDVNFGPINPGRPDQAKGPEVTYNSQTNQYLVVWSSDDTTNNEFEVYGQLLDAGGAEIGTNDFRISDMGSDGNEAFDAFDPVVTYNSRDNQYLVIWRGNDNTPPLNSGETEIYGQLLDAAGAQIGTNDFRISDAGGFGSTDTEVDTPAVTYNAISNEFLVVWVADDTGINNEYEIFGQRLNGQSGAEIGANDFRISDMGPGDSFWVAVLPAVAFNSANNQYLTVWSGEENNAGVWVNEEYEIAGQQLEFAPPAVSRVNSVANTGDSSLAEGEVTGASITQLLVTFNEAMLDPTGNGGANDVTNPANYALLTSGADNVFQTTACGAPQGDDQVVAVNGVSYNGTTSVATLSVNGGTALATSAYRLLVCGAIADTDPLGPNLLDGNGDGIPGGDFARNFAVDRTPPTINALDVTAAASSQEGAIVMFGRNITASDTTDTSVSINCTPVSGSLFPIGTTTVTCTATDDAGNSASDTFTVTVTTGINLGVAVTSAPEQASPGARLTYTVTISNSGLAAASGVQVVNTLPAGVTLVSASPGCSGAGPVTCNIGALASQASATVTIVVTVNANAAGTLTFEASVKANEEDVSQENNTVKQSTTVNQPGEGPPRNAVFMPLVRR